MGQPELPSTQGSNSPAMVFTNSYGQVVYVNRNFANLNKTAASKISAGLHLHEVLPIPVSSANQLIDLVRRGSYGYVAQLPISMPTESGTPWNSTCQAVGAFNIDGTVIGIDLVLEDTVRQDSGTTRGIKTHSAVIMTYVKNVFKQSNIHHSATFTQSYLIAQLEVLQIMLARVGGPSVRLAFEEVVIRTTRNHLIPCTIQQGHLNFSEKNIDIQKYSIMLKSAIGYAIDVVGRHIVKQEMFTVDQSIEPGSLQLISQLDLNLLFAD